MADKNGAASNSERNLILALSGGVGGAKLVLGLSKMVAADDLTIIANTADDFNHLGLSICPDLDTVMYTLAGLNDQQQGWGLANESWNTMDALAELGGDTWFRLGDRDLATHLERSLRLSQGQGLAAVTQYLCERLGVKHKLLPMSDQAVRTKIKTISGELAFQEYFVRDQCAPAISGLYFEGLDQAVPHPELMAILASERLAAIIICPSNPFVSVDPILKLDGVGEAMRNSAAPVVAVSPIVAGMAIKGPAAKMMAELNMPVTALAVAAHYGDLLDGFIIDKSDQHLAPAIAQLDIKVCCVPTVMKTLEDRLNLARDVLAFAGTLSGSL
ncbi:MAG: 2-phospho-L-lactate transferase [Spongiibacteraceae bacterium]